MTHGILLKPETANLHLRKEFECMKKVLAGGILSLAGSVWAFAIMITAGSNLVNEWNTELGRFWSTVVAMRLMLPFVLSAVLAIFGISIVLVELFRKEK